MANELFYGDNLSVLRESFASQSVDLIYLDPPFNSKATYNVLFRAPSGEQSREQVQAFEDTWHWGEEARLAYHEVVEKSGSPAAGILRAFRQFLGENDVMAYLTMMSQRLIELHRVLKPTGSLYLHCDPTASHYLKILLDGIFGATRFRNEVVWKRTSAHSSAKRYGPVHDDIFFYTRGDNYTWNKIYQDYDASYIENFYTHVDEDGRRWRRSDLTGAGTRKGETGQVWRGIDVTAKGRHWAYPPSELEAMEREGRIHWPKKPGGMPMLKRYLDEQPGMPAQDVVTDIPPMHNLSDERLGYPTQKPLALLERLIAASSDPGMVVLDPFCGCGTAIEAAHSLDRYWYGIDVTHIAIQVVEERLRKQFPAFRPPVIGRPTSVDAARDLASRDKHEFQLWATWLAAGHPRGGGKKGKDRGVDGDAYFRVGRDQHIHAILSVKGGQNLSPTMVRDLRGTLEREGAQMGIFISLEEPTAEMRRDAEAAGTIEVGDYLLPRLQTVTVEQLLQGLRTVPAPAYDRLGAGAEGRREARRKSTRRTPDPRQQEMYYVVQNRNRPAEETAPAKDSKLAEMPLYLRNSARLATG